jgi:tRNA-splicing ligase RtcB
MKTTQAPGSRPIHIWTDEVEDSARRQLDNLAKLPFLHPHGVAVMPDVHAGIGSTVGTVIATHKAIIPAAVGVDIGCGMNAVRVSLKASDLPDSLGELRHDIERSVPLGAGGAHRDDKPLHAEAPASVLAAASTRNAGKQLGTLGSGNHFIEICLDENEDVWVVLN